MLLSVYRNKYRDPHRTGHKVRKTVEHSAPRSAFIKPLPWRLRNLHRRHEDCKSERWGVTEKRVSSGTRRLINTREHRDCDHTEDQHRSKPGKAPALRRGDKHKVQPLTQKRVAIATC